MARRHAWRVGLGVALLGLLAYCVTRPSDPREVAVGPALAQVVERQVLRVGVRSYPRPTFSRAALRAEPDELDRALAEALGRYLGVPVKLHGVAPGDPQRALREGQVDVLIAGSLVLPGAASTALQRPPAEYRVGGLLALRNGPLPADGGLDGQSVCLAFGSPWQAALEQRGARPRPYPSSIRAALAFMGGECTLLADERHALKVLQSQEAWRFYRLLPDALLARDDARIYLPRADRQSLAFLQAALGDWQRQGGQARAWALRNTALIIDSLKLGEGLVCH